MRKVFLAMVMCMLTVSSFAQWTKTEYKADELEGTDAYTSYVYSNKIGDFIFWSIKHDSFKIHTNESFFSTLSARGARGEHIFIAKVGFYDVDNTLVDKYDMCFEIYGNGDIKYARPNKYTQMGKPQKKVVMKMLDYMQNSKGYIRIIAPLYNSVNQFDLTVPCMNN